MRIVVPPLLLLNSNHDVINGNASSFVQLRTTGIAPSSGVGSSFIALGNYNLGDILKQQINEISLGCGALEVDD